MYLYVRERCIHDFWPVRARRGSQNHITRLPVQSGILLVGQMILPNIGQHGVLNNASFVSSIVAFVETIVRQRTDNLLCCSRFNVGLTVVS